MSSKEDIANLALLKIGVTPVALNDPESEVARAINQIYEPARTKLLRLHNWHFALKSAQIQEVPQGSSANHGLSFRNALYGPRIFGDDTAPGFRRRKFALPADLIKLDVILHPYRIPYELEGQYLFCSAHHVRLRYVRDVVNPNDFDPLFVDCLSHLIGSQAAYMVSGAESKGQALKQELELLLRDAKRIDSQENHTRSFINSEDLYFSRLTGGYLGGY